MKLDQEIIIVRVTDCQYKEEEGAYLDGLWRHYTDERGRCAGVAVTVFHVLVPLHAIVVALCHGGTPQG